MRSRSSNSSTLSCVSTATVCAFERDPLESRVRSQPLALFSSRHAATGGAAEPRNGQRLRFHRDRPARQPRRRAPRCGSGRLCSWRAVRHRVAARAARALGERALLQVGVGPVARHQAAHSTPKRRTPARRARCRPSRRRLPNHVENSVLGRERDPSALLGRGRQARTHSTVRPGTLCCSRERSSIDVPAVRRRRGKADVHLSADARQRPALSAIAATGPAIAAVRRRKAERRAAQDLAAHGVAHVLRRRPSPRSASKRRPRSVVQAERTGRRATLDSVVVERQIRSVNRSVRRRTRRARWLSTKRRPRSSIGCCRRRTAGVAVQRVALDVRTCTSTIAVRSSVIVAVSSDGAMRLCGLLVWVVPA